MKMNEKKIPFISFSESGLFNGLRPDSNKEIPPVSTPISHLLAGNWSGRICPAPSIL
jgi:hypothetical protein